TRLSPFHHRPVGVVPLEPQPWFGQPWSKPSPVASPIHRLGLGDGAPQRAIRTRIPHRLQLAQGDVGADPAMAGVDPFFNLVAKRVDELTPLDGRHSQLTRITRLYVARDGVVRAPPPTRLRRDTFLSNRRLPGSP